MNSRPALRTARVRRWMEVASILLSVVVGLGILLAGLLSAGGSAAAGVESTQVTAQASGFAVVHSWCRIKCRWFKTSLFS